MNSLRKRFIDWFNAQVPHSIPGPDSTVIGEGSFGCVLKPALSCKGDNLAQIELNKKKVSKLLKKEDAAKEMNENKTIDIIDPHFNYHLGNPTLCESVNPVNKTSIAKCKIDKPQLNKINDYSLLIMEDGGINLTTFADEASRWEINDTNKNKIEDFWLEAHRLLMGLQLFLEKGIIHFDLKPQNIVYNVNKNRLNFIDFGFLIKRTELEEISEKSTFEYAKFHWSRPLELGYLNRNVYESIKNYHQLPTDAIDPGKPNDGITPFIAMIKNTENNKNFDNIYLDLFQNYQTLIYKNIIDDIDSND